MKDFFISYNGADEAWAVWIAWGLEAAGYTVVIQAWDFLPGEDFILEMNRAMSESRHTIAVLSQSYFNARFTQREWTEAIARDPQANAYALIPIRIGSCDLQGLWRTLVHIDIVGYAEKEAQQRLINELKAIVGSPKHSATARPSSTERRSKPKQPPPFPGSSNTTPRPGPYPPAPPPPPWIERHRVLASIIISLMLILAGIWGYHRFKPTPLTPHPVNVSFENFDRNQWVIPDKGDYRLNTSIKDPRLYVTKVPELIYLKREVCNFADFEWEAHIKLSNAGGLTWAVRVKDEGNYYLFYLAGPENGMLQPGFYIYVRFDKELIRESLHILPESVREYATSLKAGNSYLITVIAKGNRIENYITLAHDPIMDDGDNAIPPTNLGKKVNLGIFTGSKYQFDRGSIGFRTIGNEQYAIGFLHIRPLI